MTDQELMQALYADGMPLKEIARKFEIGLKQVRQELGIPQPLGKMERTVRRMAEALNGQELRTAEVAERLGMPVGISWQYLRRLERRGLVRAIGRGSKRTGRGSAIRWAMEG